jgi:hypothetical protein
MAQCLPQAALKSTLKSPIMARDRAYLGRYLSIASESRFQQNFGEVETEHALLISVSLKWLGVMVPDFSAVIIC